MWPDAGTPYLDMYMNDYRRTVRRVYNRRNANVVHHETCPCCGRKLVNLYHGVDEKQEWKCKKCWDKEGVENYG